MLIEEIIVPNFKLCFEFESSKHSKDNFARKYCPLILEIVPIRLEFLHFVNSF